MRILFNATSFKRSCSCDMKIFQHVGMKYTVTEVLVISSTRLTSSLGAATTAQLCFMYKHFANMPKTTRCLSLPVVWRMTFRGRGDRPVVVIQIAGASCTGRSRRNTFAILRTRKISLCYLSCALTIFIFSLRNVAGVSLHSFH